MKPVFAWIAVLALSLCFAGCATDKGQSTDQTQKTEKKKDTRPIEERLQVGMTKDEVRQIAGEPAGKSVNSTGQETWRYSDSAKAFIPFYTIGGGKFQNVIINFDSDGKVKDWSSGKQGLY